MAKKKKKSAAGIFFLFFLKAIVIILGLVILAMGAYLVKYTLTADNKEKDQGFDESLLVDSDRDELLASETDSDRAKDENMLFENEDGAGGVVEIASDDKIIVLNATETSGLAATWKQKLSEEGFSSIDTGNYLNGAQDTTRIVVAEGYSGDKLLNVVSDASVETGNVDEVACDCDTEDVKAIIIIGTNNDIVGN